MTLVTSGVGIIGGFAIALIPSPGITQLGGGALMATSIASFGLSLGTFVAALEAESRGQNTISNTYLSIGEGAGALVGEFSGNRDKGAAIGGLVETGAGILAGGIATSGKSAGLFTKEAFKESVTSLDSFAPNIGTVLGALPAVATLTTNDTTEDVNKKQKPIVSSKSAGDGVTTPLLLTPEQMP